MQTLSKVFPILPGFHLLLYTAQQNYYYGPSLDSNLGAGEPNFPYFQKPTQLDRYRKKNLPFDSDQFYSGRMVVLFSLIQNVAFNIKSRETFFFVEIVCRTCFSETILVFSALSVLPLTSVLS